MYVSYLTHCPAKGIVHHVIPDLTEADAERLRRDLAGGSQAIVPTITREFPSVGMTLNREVREKYGN